MSAPESGLWYIDAAFGEARLAALKSGQYQDPRDDLPSPRDVDTDPLPPCTAPCDWCSSARPCEARRRGEARALGRAS